MQPLSLDLLLDGVEDLDVSGLSGTIRASRGVEAAQEVDDLASSTVSATAGPDLTLEQELAVTERQGSMLLAAAAGSGKTSVLVERYVRGVVEDGFAPARILAITFTERAAWELKERICGRLRQLGRRELARDTEAASIGTIHGFCARLLRADPLAAGLAPGFRILEEAMAARMRLAAFSEALDATIATATRAELDLAAAYGPDRLCRMVTGIHAELRSRGQERPALPPAPQGCPRDALVAHALIASLLRRFGEGYEQRKRERDVVDFDDLELGALRVLREQPELGERWAQRFDMLMVDEFQDTNPRQLALLQALEQENLFTVGDEWQSIYGFRHADVEIFRRREAQLARRKASLALTRNFRSRPDVLDAVNAAFASRFGGRFRALTPARARAAATGAGVELLLTDARGFDDDPALADRLGAGLPAAPAWRHAEARAIARRVEELVAEGRARPGEIAVLLRSTTDIAVYEGAIEARGVPTCSASADLWETPEAQDVLCCLRALANPLDELALCGLLAGPAVGMSADVLGLLCRAARGEAGRPGLAVGPGLWETIRARAEAQAGSTEELPLAAQARLTRFHERFERERRRLGERSLTDLVRVAAEIVSGPAASWQESRAVQPPGKSVQTLTRLAADFEALEGRDLRGFLDHLAQLAEMRVPMASEPPAPDGEAVRLMSIHAAKGLEFPVVCVADLGRAPGGRDAPDLLLDGERIGLRLARLDGSAPEPALEFESLKRERDAAGAQEEDRILYVAMTRAKEMLLLSGAAPFDRWPQAGPSCPPIAWLAPALIPDLPARLATAGEEP